MLYKSETIEFLINDIKISNLCVYNDYYYFETDVELEQAKTVSEEEFAEAVNSVVHVDIFELIEPEPTEAELVQAQILLNQADILARQNEQDEVLAAILLNQMEV